MERVKILHYHKYLESFIELPKTIQKKVIDFENKFRKDSKSSAIHLEPISTFKDPTLRSARIDQTYRAILKTFNNGNIFYLLWVDHHDKAYRWAENKVINWNGETQSLQIFDDPQVTPVPTFDSESYSKETLFDSFSDKDLLRLGLPEIILPSVRKIKLEEDLYKLENFLPEGVYENLFYLAAGDDIEKLITEVEEGKVKDDALEKQVESLNNQRSFIEFSDEDIFEEVINKGLDKWKYFLHPEQRKLVNKDFSGSFKVTGGAGTGKTVAAIHRLKYLVEKSNPGEKILFTTFTKALTTNLVESAKSLDIDLSHVTIQNIDSLANEMAKKYNLIPPSSRILEYENGKSRDIWDKLLEENLVPYDADFLEKEYCDVVLNNNVKDLRDYIRTYRVGRGTPISRRKKKEIWEFFLIFKKLKEKDNYFYKSELYNKLADHLKNEGITPFAHCIVDELQDFSNTELRLVRSLVEEKSNDLFMVGDPLQKIYDRRINFSRGAGIIVRGKKSKRLRVNYRTSEEIRRLALSIVKEIKFDDFDGEEEKKTGYVSLFHGEKPTYELYKSKGEEVDQLLNKIKEIVNQGFGLDEMAISSRFRNGYNEFLKTLHERNIPYCEYKNGSKVGDASGISLMTFHNIKGLEFKHVFLVDVNERSCPFLPSNFDYLPEEEQEVHIRSERSLLYVAISRAIEKVEISGVGERAELISI